MMNSDSPLSLQWDTQRAKTAYQNEWWVNETLADSLRKTADEEPDRLLIVEGEVQLDARTVYDQALGLARALMERAPPESVISFMLPNWHETAIIYHAITLAGMVAHPVIPSLRDRELSFMLEDADSRLLFVPGNYRGHDYVAMIDRVLRNLTSPPEVVVLRGESRKHTDFEKLRAATPGKGKTPDLDPDAVRLLMYTSGTTGRSKGVLHTHNTLHALLCQIGKYWLVEPGDTFLVPSPISHIGGSIYAFEGPLLLGTTAVLMDRWVPENALAIASSYPCTHICGATPFLETLLETAIQNNEHLPALKLFVCGGASVPPSLIREAAAHFHNTVVTRVYGSTEVPVTTIGSPDRTDLVHAAETDGRPGFAEIRLSGDREEGEILVRGPQMLIGYLHGVGESEAFDEDGYYRTGDLGTVTDGEYLVVSGRAKDIIIRNGENISPKEIEDLLVEHPGIAEVAVVGIPNEHTGERSCAIIVAEPGAYPDVSGLAEFLGSRGVAKFKFPEQVELWDALPKNDAGKVLKHVIRNLLTTENR